MSSEKRPYELRARAETQRQTRERIVRATMELHQEVGPARTTIAEVARRAGVQRLTVYNHFPDEAELFGACQAHWLTLHPLPEFGPALGLRDPAERLRAAVHAQYSWYRETEPMAEKVQRDRGSVAALDRLLERTADAGLGQLADALTDGLTSARRRAQDVRPLVRLSLDFWTWRRLSREGLDDGAAATLMADAVVRIEVDACGEG
jgi:AcrR family transcriptional regulator